MMTKTAYYMQMAQEAAAQITGSKEQWTAFLTTSARLYKYPFAEQLMIYKQRPEATACAEYDLWNDRMNRYVKRGSKGIALLDMRGEQPKLRYVFDVADTGERKNSRPVQLWKMNAEHEQPIIRALDAAFDVPAGAGSLENHIMEAAERLARDYWEENRRQISDIVADSYLEGYDELNIGASFKRAAAVSIAYSVFTRTVGNADDYFEHEDFLDIFDFNTQAAANVLGTAVSEMSSQIFREIERTIRTYERDKQAERSQNYDGAELHEERRLPDSGHPVVGAGTEASGQVREDAQSIPAGEQHAAVQSPDPDREAVPAPVGDSGDRDRTDGADDGGSSESESGTGQEIEPDGLGAAHEHAESAGRGSHSDGTYQQLNFMSLFQSEAEQIQKIDAAAENAAREAESEKPSAFVISEDEIDRMLRTGSNFEGGKIRIYALYQQQGDAKERAAFLKAEYGLGGHSYTFMDGSRGFADYNGRGILLRNYDHDREVRLTWSAVDKRLDRLVENGQYLTALELEEYRKLEQEYGAPLPMPTAAHVFPPTPPERYDTGNEHVDNMLNTAADIYARSELAAPQRFTVMETDDGYAVWDDIQDGIHVEPDGVSEEFTSEWEAETYRQQLIKKVQEREAKDWLFVDHPEMVLGEITTESTQYGKEECTVIPIPDADLGDQLHEAVQHIGGHYEAQELAPEEELSLQGETISADPNVKNFSYAVVDGDVYFRENSIMRKADLSATATGRIKGMVELRTIVQELIDYQLNDYPEDAIAQKQRELNVAYDRFADQYGLINSRANAQAFSEDSSYYLLCSLENVDENGRLKSKADMFTKRTIRPERAVTSVDTPAEALAISIGERGGVDLPYMSELLGTPGEYEKIQQELHGVIFKDPMTQGGEETGWVTADEYLSGNVREKLRVAELAAASDPAFTVNTEYLRKAQPKDLDASEIDVRLGATWVNRGYIQQFMEETFEPPFYLRRNIEVKFSPMTAEWQITGKSTPSRNDVHAYMTYGTSRANAYRILEDTLNLRDIRIYDTVEDADGKQKRVLNKKETTLAQQKQQAIKDAFQNWVWKDPYRRAELVEKYNELFNSTRPREYDGSHIRFGGMNPEIRLREHQQNAIAHVLYGGNTLLAHEVGAGKTFEMAASAMEAKRLGLCQKSMFVVPNHLTLQWANEFLRLYPSAKLLVASKKDFETARRKKFCARIATGDYDAVIIGHSQFEKIPVSAERQERILTAQIDEIENAIAEMKSQNGERFSIKQMEKTRKGLEARLEKLRATDRKDDVITFEQLGVDRLFVDEAHAFKNLFLYTKMRNVAGLSTSEAQKSSDMFMKCQYMDELTGGRGIIFATGTPVSNSMTELYTMMRYLQYGTLQQKGLTHFDSWASTFGETTTAIELAPEGTGYRARTRFAKIFNLPELMNMFKEVADIKTSDQLHLPVPEAKFETVVVQPSEHQQAMVVELSERAAAVHSGVVDPSVDNMLKITSDGRKLGLDQRLMNPLLPDDPNSKLNACVRNVLRIYEEGQSDKLTQLLFCDLSTPKNDGTFNVYEDIRAKLIQSGVPEEEIAFIHDVDTEAKKKDLFAKVRTGQVRVLLGSTQKMGAGTNVQDRLVAVHHLDVGWRPADMTQRNGRIIRQGNRNKEVQVYQYVTEGTFDAYLYQTLENKQKFISQIMTSKSPVRSCDDVDEQALSYAEIKALCAGDPQIKEKMDLDVDVARLKVLKADHQSQQYRLEDKLMKYFPAEIEKTQGFIKGFQSDIRTVAAHPLPEEGFCGMAVNGTCFTEKVEAGEAILAICKANQSLEPVPLGSYRGFKMELTFDSFQKEYQVLLKGEMTHRVPIGTSAAGNIQRLDNALAGIPARLEKAEQQLDNLRSQQEAAQAELGKPFPQEAELAEKSVRLAELDALLNMDDRGNDDPDRERTTEKPSVLAELRDRAGRIPPMTHRDDEEVAL